MTTASSPASTSQRGRLAGLSHSVGARRALRRCTRVGERTVLVGVPTIDNLGTLSIGDDCTIVSSPVTSHFVTGPAGTLTLGARVTIGHGAAITAHDNVSIGDDVHFGAFVMVMDTDFHDVGAHDREGRTSPIRVERGARIGAHVTLLRGAHIGEGAFVESGSVVSGVVPAGEHVTGVPARPATDSAGQSIDRHDANAIADVIRVTLGLSQRPSPTDRLEDLPALDSLGLLNVLLSLEDRCGVSLSHKAILEARTVAHVIALVQNASSLSTVPVNQ